MHRPETWLPRETTLRGLGLTQRPPSLAGPGQGLKMWISEPTLSPRDSASEGQDENQPILKQHSEKWWSRTVLV